MLQGYFDDSGSDGGCKPFVLAGYILSTDKWATFADDWAAEIARPPKIKYFKLHEAISAQGQFTLLHYDIRRYKILRLIELIKKHDLVGLGSYMQWHQWREFSKGLVGTAKDNPYGALFFLAIDAVLRYQQELDIFPQKIQLDFDNQGKAGEDALKWYGKLMDPEAAFTFASDYRRILEGTPRMLDDKEYVPLQAADLFAGSLRLHFENHVDPVPDFRWVYDELYPTFWQALGYTEESWRAISRTLPYGQDYEANTGID